MAVFPKLVLQRVCGYDLEVAAPAPAISQCSPASDVDAVLRAIHVKQEQVSQQNIKIQVFMSTLKVENKRPKFEIIKPDTFDRQSTNQECWISF